MRTRLGFLGLVLLLALVWFCGVRIYWGHMHRRVDPGQVDRTVVFSSMAQDYPATAEEQALIIRWFNNGKDPRPGEGHTTTLGAIVLNMKGGDSIGIWPEGQDVLTGQGGHSYFLRQPQLGVLLHSLDQSAIFPAAADGDRDPDRVAVVLEARDEAGRPVPGAVVHFGDFGVDDRTGPDGSAGPYLIAVPNRQRFPYRVDLGGCMVTPDAAPNWWNHGPNDLLRLIVRLPGCTQESARAESAIAE